MGRRGDASFGTADAFVEDILRAVALQQARVRADLARRKENRIQRLTTAARLLKSNPFTAHAIFRAGHSKFLGLIRGFGAWLK